MKLTSRLADRLETHWAAPAYSGWLLIGIGICFFAAATNTMAGWLYVLSGIIAALILISAWGSVRSHFGLRVRRLPIAPVSAGDDLTINLEIENTTNKTKLLLQVQDILPYVFRSTQSQALESIAPHHRHRWVYYLPTQNRGVYHWQEVRLRSGNPLGLFWSGRYHTAPAKAIVYPQVLPLSPCPLIDSIGQEDSPLMVCDRRYSAAAEGITRTLRPYRYGDPTRLIHWRTSARLGNFQVRELEAITGSQDVVICLDSHFPWQKECFEQAVIAAASLYFYAGRTQMKVQLWTARTGLVQGNRVVLETLAAVETGETLTDPTLPSAPSVWLTQNLATLESLNPYSRWAFFLHPALEGVPPNSSKNSLGIAIAPDRPLGPQLQQPLTKV